MVMNLSPSASVLIGFDGVSALHLTGSADLFASAILEDGYGGRIPCYEVCIVGLSVAPFRAESGVMFRPDKTLRTAPAFDTIVVPGGIGIFTPETKRALTLWLKRRVPETRRVAVLCAGIYPLASTGLLDGRVVTTDGGSAADVAQRFPQIRVDQTKRCMRDGAFYSASGLTAGIDLSQLLVEEDYGPEIAQPAKRDLALHTAPPRLREHSAAQPHFPNQSADHFADLVAWMLRNLDEDLSIEAWPAGSACAPQPSPAPSKTSSAPRPAPSCKISASTKRAAVFPPSARLCKPLRAQSVSMTRNHFAARSRDALA